MQTLHSINRRQALAASVATLAAGTVPAVADDERTEWLDLWAAYEAQERRHVAATDAYFEATWQARQQHPEQQIRAWGLVCGGPGGHVLKGNNPKGPKHFWSLMDEYRVPAAWRKRRCTVEVINEHYGPQLDGLAELSPELAVEGAAYREQSLADLVAWKAGCEAVDDRFNVSGLQEAREAEEARYVALEQAIIEKPATGLLGVAVKLALWARTELTSTLECAGGEDNDEGQEWLAGPAVAAWADALRLAGLPERMGMERKVADHG